MSIEILVHLSAGCTVQDVCQTLGRQVADLFPKHERKGWKQNFISTLPRRPDWRAMVCKFQFHALLLWLRGNEVLQAAQGLDTSNWSDMENDAAKRAVINARDDTARADLLEEVAL